MKNEWKEEKISWLKRNKCCFYVRSGSERKLNGEWKWIADNGLVLFCLSFLETLSLKRFNGEREREREHPFAHCSGSQLSYSRHSRAIAETKVNTA